MNEVPRRKPPSTPVDPESLVAQFRAFVEDSLPEKVAGAGPVRVDLVTLLTELAALKNEVRLEARQLKSALDDFRSLAATLEGDNRRLRDALEQARERLREAARDAERPLLLELLELRDRLEAALHSVRVHRPLPIERFTGGAERFLRALGEGMKITLKRLDEVLSRNGVSPIEVEGRRFDPSTMHAAEVNHEPDQPDGIVLAELRKGFVRGGSLFRAAEVLANRVKWDEEGNDERDQERG